MEWAVVLGRIKYTKMSMAWNDSLPLSNPWPDLVLYETLLGSGDCNFMIALFVVTLILYLIPGA